MKSDINLFFKSIGLLLVVSLLMACSRDGLQSNNTDLSSLAISEGALDQIFQSSNLSYTATVGYLAKSINVVPVTEDANANVSINNVTSSTNGTRVSLDPGLNTINIIVTAANGLDQSTYTLDITRDTLADFATQAYAKSFNTDASDGFGSSVAMSDNLLAIGAQGEASGVPGINQIPDESASGAGAVYVYVLDSGTWVPEAYIKASNPEAGDFFGAKVALSGNTLVVSAQNEDSNSSGINSTVNDDGNADNSGAVYVFTRDNDGNWSQQAYIKASNPGADDQFGGSLDIDGDTLVIGAFFEDSNSSGIDSTVNDDGNADNSGAVYVFTRDNDGIWSQQAYIKASNPGADDQFGRVALYDDTLAIGAPLEDSNSSGIDSTVNDDGSANNSGAVYIFTRSTNIWSQQAYIKSTNNQAGDFFGIVDINKDTLIIGAFGDDSATYGINTTPNDTGANDQSGAAYVYTRDNNNVWSEQAYIKSSLTGSTNAGDSFGSVVAIQGDTIAISSFSEDSSSTGINSTADETASSAGATYVYTRDANNNWSENAYLKSSNTKAGDVYGLSLSLYADFLAVGLPLEDSNSFGIDDIYFDDVNTDGSGAVYVYQ